MLTVYGGLAAVESVTGMEINKLLDWIDGLARQSSFGGTIMAYNEEKLTKLKSLKQLAQKINEDFVTKKDVEALSERVDDIVSIGGEPNVITAIKVNGEAQAVAGKAVDIAVPTSKDISEAAMAAVTAAGHLKRKKVDNAEAIDLSSADADQYIYLVPKGMEADADKFDEYMVLDGVLEKVGDWAVELSGYVQKEDGKGLSTNDYTDADRVKLSGLEEATDAEVAEMLTEVFGVNE